MPHWYMESSQRMGSRPEMGRTLRLLLMGLSNHSCAGVVQMDRVSAFQAEDAGSSPVTCSKHTPIIQLGESIPYKDEVGGSSPSWSIKNVSLAQLVEQSALNR